MVKLIDIANKAGVSISTVSNVLNGKSNVGKETRENIIKLCEEMNYVPNMAGKNLKSLENKTVLFTFNDFDRPFYLKIIAGISDCVNHYEYDLLICTEKALEKYMNLSMTCGCISLDQRITNDKIEKYANEDYPVVVIDRVLDNPYIKCMIVDNYSSMSILVQGLVDRGYRKFGFLGGIEHTADNRERYQAFLDVLEKNNINFEQENYYSGNYKEESGYRAAKLMLLSGRIPEVLVCANDSMAIGAIKAYKSAKKSIPNDIAITGFDDGETAAAMGLTTVKIPDYERGYLATKALIENIRGKKNMDIFRINSEVVWRKTTKKKESSTF